MSLVYYAWMSKFVELLVIVFMMMPGFFMVMSWLGAFYFDIFIRNPLQPYFYMVKLSGYITIVGGTILCVQLLGYPTQT